MILLFCDLWGCTEGGLFCKANAKRKKDNYINVEDTDIKYGKIIVSIVIFIIFSTTFTLGFWTVGHVLDFIDLRFVYIGSFNLRSAVITGYFAPWP